MNRILVPTDFSPAADNALAFAMELAARSNAEVVALHVLTLPIPAYAVQPEGIQEYNQLRIEEGRRGLQAYQERYAGSGNLTTVIANGEMNEVVPEKALSYDADFVVMGTRGADGLRTVFGTNAADVLRRCTVPVLVVPGNYQGGLPKKMALAVQQEERESLLAPVFRIQALCGAGLTAVHFVDEKTPEAKRGQRVEELEQLSAKWQRDFQTSPIASALISGDDFSEALEDFSDDNGIDMMVMVTHRKQGLQALFGKSMTRAQAIHTRVPLLSLHA